MSEQDLMAFMGEFMALGIYATKNSVVSWKKDPKLTNGLTPDFIINDNTYIEIYSPQIHALKEFDKCIINTRA